MYTHVINYRRTKIYYFSKFIDRRWLKCTLLETYCLPLNYQYVSCGASTETYKFDRNPNPVVVSLATSQVSCTNASPLDRTHKITYTTVMEKLKRFASIISEFDEERKSKWLDNIEELIDNCENGEEYGYSSPG